MMLEKREILKPTVIAFLAAIVFAVPTTALSQSSSAYDYRVLATNKTSSMQKEMSDAADAGYRMEKVMGGSSMFGGSEVVVIMSKMKSDAPKPRYAYKLLATKKTETMQGELQEVGKEGFDYKDQTVFNSTFGGDEVVVILDLDRDAKAKVRFEYKLLATNKTTTMQKELQEAGDAGFKFVGVTVSKTTFGGKEVLSILRKEVAQ